jgi:hypothetical protein
LHRNSAPFSRSIFAGRDLKEVVDRVRLYSWNCFPAGSSIVRGLTQPSNGAISCQRAAELPMATGKDHSRTGRKGLTRVSVVFKAKINTTLLNTKRWSGICLDATAPASDCWLAYL